LSGYTIDNLSLASYDLVKEALARFGYDKLIDGWIDIMGVCVYFEKMMVDG